MTDIVFRTRLLMDRTLTTVKNDGHCFQDPTPDGHGFRMRRTSEFASDRRERLDVLLNDLLLLQEQAKPDPCQKGCGTFALQAALAAEVAVVLAASPSDVDVCLDDLAHSPVAEARGFSGDGTTCQHARLEDSPRLARSLLKPLDHSQSQITYLE